MAWIGMALFLLFITPVRMGIRLEWSEGALRGAVGVTVWGIRGQAFLTGQRGGDGRLTLTAAVGERKIPLALPRGGGGGAKRLLGLMLRANGSGAWLRRFVRVQRCEAAVRLGGGNAAALALGAGFLRAMGGALPFLRLFCVPALGGSSGLKAVCIAEARLGILWTAWLIESRKKRAGTPEQPPPRG